MTIQHFEVPSASYGVSDGGGSVLLVSAADPEQPGRTANFVVGNALTAADGFGYGPVFTAPVVRLTGLD